MAKSEEKIQPAKSAKKSAPKQHKVTKYFRDLKSEFKKVVWPTKKQVIHNTWIVLVTVICTSVFIFALDSGLAALFNVITGLGK